MRQTREGVFAGRAGRADGARDWRQHHQEEHQYFLWHFLWQAINRSLGVFCVPFVEKKKHFCRQSGCGMNDETPARRAPGG
jgi:hypothetical protein